MNAFLFKPKRRVEGKLCKGKFWHVAYQPVADGPYKSHSLGVRDEQVAAKRLNEFVQERECEAAGVGIPKPLREAASKLMTAHLADFVADLRARQRSRMYVSNVESRATILLESCGWSYPRDVTIDSFTSWRCVQDKAAKTLNDYLDVANALLNWMRDRGRLLANPLHGVGKVETAGKQRRVRRAFTVEELHRLLAVAGPRRPLYLAALLTGLRRSELRSLEWGDVHLDAVKPFLSVRAATTKNGKSATIWLRDDLAAELRKVRPADPAATARVFPGLGRKLDAFKADLEVAKIPFKVAGCQADLHSLRHTLATILAQSNVAPRVTMEVMRHSDIRLTMGAYTDASQLPTAEALEQLPRFAEPGRQTLAATGTDDASTEDVSKDSLTTENHTEKLVKPRPGVSIAVNGRGSRDAQNRPENQGENADLSSAVRSCPDVSGSRGTRIRT